MSLQQPDPLRIQLLGGFRISFGERSIPPQQFRLRKARNLIKLLALAPDHRLHRDQLIEWLWPEADPESAANNLYQAVYAARRVLAAHNLPAQEILPFIDEFLSLCPDTPLWIDVEAFETAAKKARSSQDPAAFQAALDLYPSDLLPEDRYEDWAASRREMLRQERLQLLLRLAVLQDRNKDSTAAIAAFKQALVVEPACEEAHAALMRLYALSGQRSAALAQYETCRVALEKELGVSPAPETTTLYQQISIGTLSTQAPQTFQAQSDSPHRGNLPSFLIPFVGRQGLLASIRERLSDPTCRLLSLVGPGGCGKTRLAVEAVSTLAEDFPHGIYYVPLVGLGSPAAIIPAIAQSIGFTFYDKDDPRQQLLDYLSDKTLLLVLDNFEHLLTGEEGTDIVTTVLEAAPRVKALVTSRARLNLLCETLLTIHGMRTPQDSSIPIEEVLEYSAVRLFLEGARRVTPGFQPDRESLVHILEVCRLLEGMPLAILLASVWTRLLSPAEIASQLASRSLDFLESRSRDLPERQRSIRAVFDHSWRLLDEEERHLFAALSVFRGGFTAVAANQICGATLEELARLVDHSFLDRTGTGRFEVHELLRQYGAGKLSEIPEYEQVVHERHATYFIAFLQNIVQEFVSPRRVAALADMDLEIGNVQAAWDWVVQHCQLELLKCGMQELNDYYHERSRFEEGRLAFFKTYQMLDKVPKSNQPEFLILKAKLLGYQALFERAQKRDDVGYNLLQKSLDMVGQAGQAGHDVRQVKAKLILDIYKGHFEKYTIENGINLLNSSRAVFHEIDDHINEASILESLAGNFITATGNFDESVRLIRQALAIHSQFNHPPIQTHLAQINLIYNTSYMGDFEDAETKLVESINYARQIGAKRVLARGLYVLANYYYRAGQFSLMLDPLKEVEGIFEEMKYGPERALMWIGTAHTALGQIDQARTALSKSLDIYVKGNVPTTWCVGFLNWRLGELALLIGQPAQAYELLHESLENLVHNDYGLAAQAQPFLAIAALKEADLSFAYQAQAEALRRAAEYRNFPAQANALASAALFAAQSRKIELAVELVALAATIPYLSNSAVFQELVFKPLADLALDLPPEVATAAQERGRQRDLWQTIRELQTAPEFTQN